MKQTENYGFEKPDIKEFFKLETWKNNMDKIDEAIKERETAQEVTDEEIKKIKNVQFTQADERKNIESKETLPVLFGKIARWIADLKTVAFSGNYNDLSNKPTIPTVVNNNTTTEAGYALDARQANPNVDGSLAKQISMLNSGLGNSFKGKYDVLVSSLSNNATWTQYQIADVTKYKFLQLQVRDENYSEIASNIIAYDFFKDCNTYQRTFGVWANAWKNFEYCVLCCYVDNTHVALYVGTGLRQVVLSGLY